MGLIDRNGLLEKHPVCVEKVDLGDGEFVFVREMSGQGGDLYQQSLARQIEKEGKVDFALDNSDFRAKLAVHVVCDAEGNLLLKPEDYLELSKNMSTRKLKLIVDKAQELNKISTSDKEKIVKNLEGG